MAVMHVKTCVTFPIHFDFSYQCISHNSCSEDAIYGRHFTCRKSLFYKMTLKTLIDSELASACTFAMHGGSWQFTQYNYFGPFLFL